MNVVTLYTIFNRGSSSGGRERTQLRTLVMDSNPEVLPGTICLEFSV